MSNENLSISVIISTYNQPDALRLVLLALTDQNTCGFEVIVADDGSQDDTEKTLEILKPSLNYNLKHVWQPHENFRAAMIRNKSVVLATSDYLVFLDGDSIPTRSFISKHRQLAENRYFVSGNRILLSSDFTKKVLQQSIFLHQWKTGQWLYGFSRGWINRMSPLLSLPDFWWRYLFKNKWRGAKTCNLGVWKKDFVTVNGFDESYCGWGYEDSDFIVRLIRSGILRKEGRFAVPVFHLWHPQNDRNSELENYKRLEETIHATRIKSKCGVDQYISTE